MSPDLTPVQDQVLALISAGFSATVAARQTGIHRHTVANWLQNEKFRVALQTARDRKRLLYLDHAEDLAVSATGNLARMADDRSVPAAVRLKATIAMLEHARLFLNLNSGMVFPEVAPHAAVTPQAPPPEPVENSMSKNVQSAPDAVEEIDPRPEAEAPAMPVTSQKIGRNELCPCGSGIKFKRCCLGKPASPLPAAAAA